MDLHEFECKDMYFDEPISEEVEQLIDKAAAAYSEGDAEPYLLKAYFLSPENLSVLVALYRFFYYDHRPADALIVAERAMQVAAKRLQIKNDWKNLSLSHLGIAAQNSLGMLRFYLLSLKGSAYLLMRLERVVEGRERLQKVVELDPKDRLGARYLLQMAITIENENVVPISDRIGFAG